MEEANLLYLLSLMSSTAIGQIGCQKEENKNYIFPCTPLGGKIS